MAGERLGDGHILKLNLTLFLWFVMQQKSGSTQSNGKSNGKSSYYSSR